MAKRGRSREKARREHVRREAEAAKALVDGKKGLADVIGRPEPRGNLRDMLRNVNRTATRSLDEAGVPDRLQGAGQEEWEDYE